MENFNKNVPQFKDKIIVCCDCQVGFVFSSGEQRFFASKPGLVEPKRCPECRRRRKLTLMPGGGGRDAKVASHEN